MPCGGGITRRRLLVAAGTVIAAPGCLGRSASTTPPAAAPGAAPPHLPGPLRVLAPAGSVPADDRIAFTQATGVGVDVRTIAPGANLIELISSGYPADVVLARQDDVAVLGEQGLLRQLDHDLIPQPLASSRRTSSTWPTTATTTGRRRPATACTASATAATSSPSGPPTGPTSSPLVPRYSLQGITFLPGPIEPVAAALAALDEDIYDRRRLDAPARPVAAARRPAARERVHRRRGGGVRARRARARDGHERRLRPRPRAAGARGRHRLRAARPAAPRCGSTAGRCRARPATRSPPWPGSTTSSRPGPRRARGSQSRLPAPEAAAAKLAARRRAVGSAGRARPGARQALPAGRHLADRPAEAGRDLGAGAAPPG